MLGRLVAPSDNHTAVRVYQVAPYLLAPAHKQGGVKLEAEKFGDLKLSALQWDGQFDAACCVMCKVLCARNLYIGSPDLVDQEIADEVTGEFLFELFAGGAVPPCTHSESRKEAICLRKRKQSSKPARPVVSPLTLQIPIM